MFCCVCMLTLLPYTQTVGCNGMMKRNISICFESCPLFETWLDNYVQMDNIYFNFVNIGQYILSWIVARCLLLLDHICWCIHQCWRYLYVTGSWHRIINCGRWQFDQAYSLSLFNMLITNLTMPLNCTWQENHAHS